jgi:uncharacterized protein (TIGR02466 family)
MAMHTELWFPSVIWSAVIHHIDNKALRHWAYDRKRNDVGRVISNYSGYQSSDINNIWLNINPPGAYNHLHNHVGAVLSGVYYVEAGSNHGNIQFERSDGGEYHIPEYVNKETYYTSTRATYAAKTGALYIFPGWLKHSVQGNTANTDRISISFNYGEA